MGTSQVVTPWYQNSLFTNLVCGLIGVVITTIVTIVIFVMTNKYNSNVRKKDLLITIVQTNSKLFSLIYKGSLEESNIDYVTLREELFSTSIIFLLPKDLKQIFDNLYEIHCRGPKYYNDNKYKIKNYLLDIKRKLDDYGVDIFGDK